MSTKFVQANTLYLAGSGVVIGATSITLTSLTDIYGNAITSITPFGGKGYITLEPDTTNEESATFTGVTVNANGTVTLTGAKTSLAQSPYTETSGLVRQHSGGTKVVITDTAAFYDTFSNVANDETVTGTWTFTSPNYPAMDSVAVPPTLDGQFATKKYADDLAIAGAPKATEAVYGIAKLSVAAVSAVDPIVVGTNDGRVPSQGENDALAGTSGTPSSTNKYVTNDDTSASPAANKVVRYSAASKLDATALTGNLPAISGASLTGITDTQIADLNGYIGTQNLSAGANTITAGYQSTWRMCVIYGVNTAPSGDGSSGSGDIIIFSTGKTSGGFSNKTASASAPGISASFSGTTITIYVGSTGGDSSYSATAYYYR